MAGITSAMTNQFRQHLMTKKYDFTNGADVFKIALFKANASIVGTYVKATNNYSDMTGNSDELPNGSGYTTGGATLSTNTTPIINSNVACATWGTNPSWSTATFTTRGALIYDSTVSNECTSVYDFGSDQSVSAGTLTLVLPANTAGNAILQLA
jgi:hypothetical protein